MRCYSHLSDDERDWDGQSFTPFDWRDRASDAISCRERTLQPALRKSITLDNNTAFAQHALLRTMRATTTWFCDAYASWRKARRKRQRSITPLVASSSTVRASFRWQLSDEPTMAWRLLSHCRTMETCRYRRRAALGTETVSDPLLVFTCPLRVLPDRFR
jgi:hypothetical protein